MRLRAYAPGDFNRLHALDQACFAPGVAYSKAELRWFIDSPSAFTVVAVDDDPAVPGERIVGFAVVRTMRVVARPTLHIITIDVDPETRRQGTGSLLMRWMEERAVALRLQVIRLEVAENNIDAQRFYQRHSFTIVSRIPGYYGPALDAFVMERRVVTQQPASSNRPD